MKYVFGSVLIAILTMCVSAGIQAQPVWYVRPLIFLHLCSLFLLAAIFLVYRSIIRTGERSASHNLVLLSFYLIAVFPALFRSVVVEQRAEVETWHLVALFGLRHIFLVFIFFVCVIVILKVYLVLSRKASPMAPKPTERKSEK